LTREDILQKLAKDYGRDPRTVEAWIAAGKELLIQQQEIDKSKQPLSRSKTDMEILTLMAQVFDRPAFTERFARPRPFPDFRKAISDTIEALNTGLRRTRDGFEIGGYPVAMT
jgi:hypothetical protein